MKMEFLKRVKMLIAPAALAVALMAFSPAAAVAANYGGHGFGGGHGGGYSGGRSFSGAVHGNFRVGPSYGGRGYYGGHAYGAPFYNGGGRYYGGRGYYGRGFGFGIYASPGYGYAAPVCSPAGFYDQRGYWHYYGGCFVPPYGY